MAIETRAEENICCSLDRANTSQAFDMKKRLLEIVELAQKNGLDPVSEVKDYLEEKDSHVTWSEAARIVDRILQSVGTTQA